MLKLTRWRTKILKLTVRVDLRDNRAGLEISYNAFLGICLSICGSFYKFYSFVDCWIISVNFT